MGGYIVKMKDKVTGEVKLPVTVSDAVRIGKLTLTKWLELYMPEAAYVTTIEDGLYICDERGYILTSWNEEGLQGILGEHLKREIASISRETLIVIDELESKPIFQYSRLTDGGVTESIVYSSVVYAKDITKGLHTMTIKCGKYLHKDYFNIKANTAYSVESISFGNKEITLKVDVKEDTPDLYIIVEYAALSPSEYDEVKIRVKTANTEATPEFARVKFNKLCPVVYTSDDMGYDEYTGAWCLFNGYATGAASGKYPGGIDVLNGVNMGAEYPVHKPLSYSDGAGGVRRYAHTCAIWPQNAAGGNYTKMDGYDGAIMTRLGTGFSIHDVDITTDVGTIASRFEPLSDIWKEYTGEGIKTMVEPNGDKRYERAVELSRYICLSVMQNTRTEDPDITALSALIDDWKVGTDIMSYRRKGLKALIRDFIDGKEQNLFNDVANADGGRIIITGSHGMATSVKDWLLSTSVNRDDLWVCSVDELWEYYHLVNHSIIDIASYDEEINELTFSVVIPKYSKSRFRELTVNIPITDGELISLEGAITSSYRQNEDSMTINIGVSDNIYRYITDVLALLKEYPLNSCIRRDAKYLISRLSEGATKEMYKEALKNIPDARYIVSVNVQNAEGEPIVGAVGVLTVGGIEYEAISIINGDMSFAHIPAGSGSLTIQATGYATKTIDLDLVGFVEIVQTMRSSMQDD